MKNLEKYESSLDSALAAYNGEMADRAENGIDGLPFEDWVLEDEGATARLVAEEKKRKEAIAAALANEKEAVRKGMEELKVYYKANGFDKAKAIIDEVFKLDPSMHIYEELASACNCMHSGMWSVWCDDFAGVWDSYSFGKNERGILHSWDNPIEWLAEMKELAQCIEPFLKDGEEYLENLKAKKEGGKKA